MKSFIKYCSLTFLLGVSFLSSLYGQDKVSLKTNLLHDATGSIHGGLEYGLSRQWSVAVSSAYNAWDVSSHRKWRHLLIQPEARYWFCERHNGSFIGVHVHWMKFNLANLKLPLGLWKDLHQYRNEGDLWGGGFMYGYSWLLSKHWNLETVIGIGYAHILYDKYPCSTCGKKLESNHKNYWGPTQLALNLVYLF